MASFGAVNFGIRITSSGPGGGAVYSETKIPGGGVIIDNAGPGALHGQYELYFPDHDDFESLLAQRGTQATFVDENGTSYTDTLLVELRRIEVNPIGDYACKANAEFIVPVA